MMKDNRSSNKTLVIIIAILLIANIATLALFLLSRPGEKNDRDERKNAMRNYLKNDLSFSSAQLTQFDSLKSRQRTEMKSIFDGIRADKQLVLRNVGSQSFSDSAVNAAAEAAVNQQKQVELKLLGHLKAIRMLCTPDQLTHFDTGFYKIMSRPPGDDKKKEK